MGAAKVAGLLGGLSAAGKLAGLLALGMGPLSVLFQSGVMSSMSTYTGRG